MRLRVGVGTNGRINGRSTASAVSLARNRELQQSPHNAGWSSRCLSSTLKHKNNRPGGARTDALIVSARAAGF
eukprot:2371368-Rhodomonas_salina.6